MVSRSLRNILAIAVLGPAVAACASGADLAGKPGECIEVKERDYVLFKDRDRTYSEPCGKAKLARTMIETGAKTNNPHMSTVGLIYARKSDPKLGEAIDEHADSIEKPQEWDCGVNEIIQTGPKTFKMKQKCVPVVR